MGFTSLEDRKAIAVHADELEERGDPRAELIRAQLSGGDGAQLIAQHWSAWVGSASPQETLLRWESGHLIEVALRRVPDAWRLRELLERPAAHFLGRLAVGRAVHVSLAGLEQLPCLRELSCFSDSPAALEGLAGRQLEGLRTLTIDAQQAIPEALSTARFPHLAELNTRCSAGHEELLFSTLARARWFPQLARWTHRVRSLEGLMALRVCQPLVEREGLGLVALCEEPVLRQVSAVKQWLPRAEFTLLPTPARPSDPEDSHSPAEVAVTPGLAPMNFRSLPPWTTTSSPGTPGYNENLSRNEGSGIPFAQLNWTHRKFVLCGWCGSAETRCIYESGSSMYSHFETTKYAHWEYECVRCRLFTSTGSVFAY